MSALIRRQKSEQQESNQWEMVERWMSLLFHPLMQRAHLTMWIDSWMSQFQDWERTSEQVYAIFYRLFILVEKNIWHKRNQLLQHCNVASDTFTLTLPRHKANTTNMIHVWRSTRTIMVNVSRWMKWAIHKTHPTVQSQSAEKVTNTLWERAHSVSVKLCSPRFWKL